MGLLKSLSNSLGNIITSVDNRPMAAKMQQPFYRDQEILLGIEPEKNSKGLFEGVYLNWGDLCTHSLLLGSTGVGKSRMMESVAAQAIRNGWGVVFVDLKGDMDALMRMYSAAHFMGRGQDFRIINTTAISHPHSDFGRLGTCSWNPLLSQSDPENLISLLLSAAISDDAPGFYKNMLEKNFRMLALGLMSTGKPFTLADCASVVKSERGLRMFKAMAAKSTTATAQAEAYLKLLENEKTADKYFEKTLDAEMFFERFTESALGSIMNTTQPDISLKQAYWNQQIVWIYLPSMLAQQTANAAGKMLMAEMVSLIGETLLNVGEGKRKKLLFMCDELEKILIPEGLLDITAMGRSSDCALFGALQNISQIDSQHGLFTRNSIIGNMKTKICFHSKEEATTKLISSVIGEEAFKEALRAGLVSATVADSARVSETDIGDLRKFEFVLSKPDEYKIAQLAISPAKYTMGIDFPAPDYKPTITTEGGVQIYDAIAKG